MVSGVFCTSSPVFLQRFQCVLFATGKRFFLQRFAGADAGAGGTVVGVGRVAGEAGVVVEGSLEVKLRQYGQMKSTARKKQSQEETRAWRKSEGRRSEMEKVRREKIQMRGKVGKSLRTVFFQCFVAPPGRKVGSLKRRVPRHLGR